MAVGRITLTFILVLVGAALSESCSCFPRHMQSHFCNSDFVLQVTMFDVEKRDHVHIYRGLIEQKYKMPDGVPIMGTDETTGKEIAYIHTGAQGAMCGMEYDMHKTYIVAGSFLKKEGVLRSELCDMNKQAEPGYIQRLAYYSSNQADICDCGVEVCFSPRCEEEVVDGCTTAWPPTPPDSCADSVCHRTLEGACEWKDVNTCRRKRRLPAWLLGPSARSVSKH